MITQRALRVGETLLGLFVLALGLFIAFETWLMPAVAVTAGIGPKFFPGLVAGGLIVTSAFLLHEALVGSMDERAGEELDWFAVATITGGLMIHLAILQSVGWIVATAFLFTAGAFAFGSRRWLLNVAIGLTLGAITYGVFDYGLDLDLPTGSIIETILSPALN